MACGAMAEPQAIAPQALACARASSRLGPVASQSGATRHPLLPPPCEACDSAAIALLGKGLALTIKKCHHAEVESQTSVCPTGAKLRAIYKAAF